MSVKNIQSIDMYPEKYAEEDSDIWDAIVNYMNGMQELANRYYDQYLENIEDNDKTGKYIVQYNHTITSLTGSKNAFAILNIMVEYDWPDHKGEWFLATKEDALAYENYQEPEDTEPITYTNQLLDYGDVGQ